MAEKKVEMLQKKAKQREEEARILAFYLASLEQGPKGVFARMASAWPGAAERSDQQRTALRKRFQGLLGKNGRLCPKKARTEWTASEDRRLMHVINDSRPNIPEWGAVKVEFPHRTAHGLRDRARVIAGIDKPQRCAYGYDTPTRCVKTRLSELAGK